MYRADRNIVYYNDEFICSISPPRGELDETRLPGESWLAMRERTKPQREERRRKAKEMAKNVAASLNIAYS